jgi:hypothetical protein
MTAALETAQPTETLPIIYGVIHALIDLTTVSVVCRTIFAHEMCTVERA